MKTCGVTAAIWVDDAVISTTKQVAKRFEKLNNMEVKVILGADLDKQFLSSAHFTKYHVWDIVGKDVDRVIWLDSDTIPIQPLPALPAVDFAAVLDNQLRYDECAKNWPIVERAGIYFSARFFIATRKTEALFKRMALRQSNASEIKTKPWYTDQTLLNLEVAAAVEAGELTFEALPRTFNNCALIDTASLVENTAMLSLAWGHKLRHRAIRHIIEQLTLIEQAAAISSRSRRKPSVKEE